MKKRWIWKPGLTRPGVLNLRCVGFGFGPDHLPEALGLLLFPAFFLGSVWLQNLEYRRGEKVLKVWVKDGPEVTTPVFR